MIMEDEFQNLPPLILASKSPRRDELLKQMGLEFQVMASRAPESHQEHLSPFEIVQLNAHRKARAIAKKFPDNLVLGADTIVYLNGAVFGKPKDRKAALEMLKKLQGKTHTVVTGVALIQLRSHKERLFAESTEVTFKSLTEEELRDYLAKVDPRDKAGGYGIQESGEMLVDHLNGLKSNVIGLPVERLEAELKNWA